MVAVCPSYIQDARFLKVNVVSAFLELLHVDTQIDILDLTGELSECLVAID
jgi:hypothetical protein